MSIRVFVYGTLLPGERNAHFLGECAVLGPATTEARFDLFDIGTYPGLVAGGSSSVVGIVYAVSPARLAWLDDLEECPGFYERAETALLDGEPAQSYLLPRERVPEGAVAIPDGDWCRWARGKPDLRLPRCADLAETLDPGRSLEAQLGSEALVRHFEQVFVAWLPDGGVVSRAQADGYHHRVCPRGEFAVVLGELGIER